MLFHVNPMERDAMRETARKIVENRGFESFILGLIIINAITIGIQTMPLDEGVAYALYVFDFICLGVYIIEAILKMIAWRGDYFRDGWNIFDLTIIVLCCVPTSIIPFPVQVARVFRVMRVFRVFRLISAFKEMRVIIQAIGRAIPGVGWTAFLLIIVYYVFAVIGTEMFGSTFPEWFGDLGASFYTLFQVMTLESWSMGISRPVMEAFPWAWAYFVPFVVISSFIIVNVVVGIIVDVVDKTRSAAEEEERVARQSAEGYDVNEDLIEQVALLKQQAEHVEALLAETRLKNADGVSDGKNTSKTLNE